MGDRSPRFAKVEALGNDFVVIEASEPPARRDALARALCDRHRGVGADGLLIIYPSAGADGRVEVWNADGSEAETSGNGLRCAACRLATAGEGERAAARTSGSAAAEIVLETRAGRSRVLLPGGSRGPIRVALGAPRFRPAEIPMRLPAEPGSPAPASDRFVEGRLPGIPVAVTALSVGNPHAVVFVDGPIDGSRLGPQIEAHPAFPERANVEFVRVVAPDHLVVLIWERGVGPTASSGTGAAAALVAASLTGRSARRARVEMEGGTLEVGWEEAGVWTEGLARIVFEGEWVGT
jgi:diaminopimelate epimerase